MDFSATVKMVREKMNMSQENLARALNIGIATINRWDNGKTHPNKMAKRVFISLYEQNMSRTAFPLRIREKRAQGKQFN